MRDYLLCDIFKIEKITPVMPFSRLSKVFTQIHHGFKCSIVEHIFFSRYPHGWGNGYVEIKEDHPLFNTGHKGASASVIVHGGLTYGDFNSKGNKVFGFDTGNLGDTIDSWPKERVWEETINLARQLRELA